MRARRWGPSGMLPLRRESEMQAEIGFRMGLGVGGDFGEPRTGDHDGGGGDELLVEGGKAGDIFGVGDGEIVGVENEQLGGDGIAEANLERLAGPGDEDGGVIGRDFPVAAGFDEGERVAKVERFGGGFVGVTPAAMADDDGGFAVFVEGFLVGLQLGVAELAVANGGDEVGLGLHLAVGVCPGEAVIEEAKESGRVCVEQCGVKGFVGAEQVAVSIGKRCACGDERGDKKNRRGTQSGCSA